MESKTLKELRGVEFPRCHKWCSFSKIMGVGECEGACPEKFDKEGRPIKKVIDKLF